MLSMPQPAHPLRPKLEAPAKPPIVGFTEPSSAYLLRCLCPWAFPWLCVAHSDPWEVWKPNEKCLSCYFRFTTHCQGGHKGVTPVWLPESGSLGGNQGQLSQDNHLEQSNSEAPEGGILKRGIPSQHKEEMRLRKQEGREIQRSSNKAVSLHKSGSDPDEATAASKIHQCHCGKSFRWTSNFWVHERIHMEEKPYKCSECGTSFRKSAQLKAHEGIHTGEVPFRCSMCQKSFTSGSNLIAHKRIHTGEKPYRCTYCGKSFRQKGTLTTHEKIHMGEKPFKCLICGKNYCQKGTLTMHKKIHLGEKPYKCSNCGKDFRTLADLRVHERIHMGVKPYQCSVCGKSFADGSNLITHKRIHTGVKPYHCVLCGKSFCQKSGLMTHKWVHTGVNPYRGSAGRKHLAEGSDPIAHWGEKLQANAASEENTANLGHFGE